MTAQPYNVLFLCTGNSARSILGEALLNRMGDGRFRAYRAGSFPKGDVHPAALALLGGLGFDTSGLRSKSWVEFSAPGAPNTAFLLPLFAKSPGENSPRWPSTQTKHA